MNERPARSAAALGTLSVAGFYLIAQMVGAGVLIQALVGIDFTLSVILTGAFMIFYIVMGGMLATSWVQIIKAVLLMTATIVLTLFVLGEVGWNPINLFTEARAESPEGQAYLEPGLFLSSPIDTVSLGLALVLGTAGLPHILMRFFTVPDAKAARGSVMWAVVLIGAFYVMTTALGFGARAILGSGAEEAVGSGGNLAAPLLAEEVGGGAGTVGGDLFLAIIAAVAFATILAVVAGLVISASGAVAHDVWSNVVRKGHDSEKEEVWVAKIAAVAIGAIAIAIAVIGGEGLNVSFMVGLAFAVAASAIFPALLLALSWRRFNTTGAVTGVLVGVSQLDRSRDHQPDGLAGGGLRGRGARLLRPRQSGHRVDPARLHRLLARHRSVARRDVGAQLRRAVGALADGPRRRDRHRPDAHGTQDRHAHRRGRHEHAAAPVDRSERGGASARPSAIIEAPVDRRLRSMRCAGRRSASTRSRSIRSPSGSTGVRIRFAPWLFKVPGLQALPRLCHPPQHLAEAPAPRRAARHARALPRLAAPARAAAGVALLRAAVDLQFGPAGLPGKPLRGRGHQGRRRRAPMSPALLALQHIACEPPAAFEDEARALERTLGPGALPAFLAEVEASASATLPLARSLFGRWLEHAVGVPRRAVG